MTPLEKATKALKEVKDEGLVTFITELMTAGAKVFISGATFIIIYKALEALIGLV